MKLEKNIIIATIALLVIVSGVTGAYLYYHYVFKEELIVESGDCVDVDYIGKFAVNDTIFDTSYEDVAKEAGIYNETYPYGALKIFVDLDGTLQIPENYSDYRSSMIPGFIEGLVGMKEGEKKTVEIPAEKAYGIWDETVFPSFPRATTYNTTNVVNITEFLTSPFFTDVNLSVNTTFDYGNISRGAPGILNATITNISAANVTFEINPINGTIYANNLTNWNETIIVENETTFSIRIDPEANATFTIVSPYGPQHFKTTSFNETHLTLGVNMEAPSISFVGQSLIFELEVVKLYKTSQLES